MVYHVDACQVAFFDDEPDGDDDDGGGGGRSLKHDVQLGSQPDQYRQHWLQQPQPQLMTMMMIMMTKTMKVMKKTAVDELVGRMTTQRRSHYNPRHTHEHPHCHTHSDIIDVVISTPILTL